MESPGSPEDRAERPAAIAGDPQDLIRIMPAKGGEGRRHGGLSH